MATASTFGFSIDRIDLNLDSIRVHADDIIQASPIPYVWDVNLRGLLFEGFDASTALISAVDTNFFVDHKESEDILNSICKARKWSFGNLVESHEYLLTLEGRSRWGIILSS